MSPANVPRWVWAACLVLVVTAALQSASKPAASGDVWVALAGGRQISGDWARDDPGRTWQMRLLDGVGVHISKQDRWSPKSRAAEDAGWINQNWFTHLVFYRLDRLWGKSAILVYIGLLAALAALAVFWTAVINGAHPALAAGAAAFATLLSRSFIDLRSHVATTLCAALTLLLLAYWKRGRHRALLLLIPVMVLWANAHGGFVYGIVVFVLLLGALVGQRLLGRFWSPLASTVDRAGAVWLVAGLGIAILVPALASPYGMENLLHPLMVTVGREAAEWRSISEWAPITSDGGFGNVTPYLYYLALAAGIVATWLVLFFRKSHGEGDAGPRLDPPMLLIGAATIWLSVGSRRFIYLAAAVSAPILAVMAQEILATLRPETRRSPRSQRLLIASIASTLLLALTVKRVYLDADLRGVRQGAFERRVAQERTPAGALEFLAANGLRGLLFNEWVDGGYLAYAQTIDPESGRLPCEIFIDGRSQAAYTLEQFNAYWELTRLAGRPDAGPSLADRSMRESGATLALLSLRRSKGLFRLLLRSGNWIPLYYSDGWVVLVRADTERNRRWIAGSADLVYPDDHSRTLTRAHLERFHRDRERRAAALSGLMAMETDRSALYIYELVSELGTELEQTGRIKQYFLEQNRRYREQIEAEGAAGRLTELNALIGSGQVLLRLAEIGGDASEVDRRAQELAADEALRKRLLNSLERRLLW